MQEIQGKTRTVRELLSGAKYGIDYYQREYKWQNKQMVELVSDLTGAFLEDYQEAHQRADVANYGHYFLGSIVISQRKNEQQISERLIVDGQQRMTSLTLLLLYLHSQQKDRDDALLAVETIEPDYVYDLNIKPGVDAFTESFAVATGEELSDFDKGNAKARERMIAHYALAGAKGLLVLGTDHAAEAVTGFYTKYGDGGADVLPLAGLTKGQGKQMLQALQVPEVFTTKAPTADLLDGTPGQADETELGIPYDMLDDYLEGKEIEPATAEAIERRYAATQHKREMPVAF